MTIETSTDHEHRPTPEFREYMEWELERAFGRGQLRRRLRAVAVIVASLGVGVAAGLAPAQVRQNSARDSLLIAAEADLRLAQLRMEVIRGQLDKDLRMMVVGALSSAVKTEIQVRDIDAQVGRIQANIEEIRMTGQSPRDELNAPMVNGRDFVSRRVDVQLAAAEARLRAAEQRVVEAERRVRVGVIPAVHELEARVEMTRVRKDLAVFAEKLALRREFLEKGTAVDQLALRLERTELEQDITLADAQVQLARERVTTMEKALAAGTIDQLEVMRATLDLRERNLEVRRLGLRLRAMQKVPPVGRRTP